MFRNVQTEPRKFNYKPRHYDPKQEALEERKRRIELEVARENGDPTGNYEPGKIQFRNSWKKQNSYRNRAKSANKRLLLILAVLIMFFFMAAKWLEGQDLWFLK